MALLTLVFGVSAFYFWNFSKQNSNFEVKKEKVIEVNNKNVSEDDLGFDPWQLPEGFQPLEKGEFFPVGHTCGNGYVDGWLAYDNSHLSEGFNVINESEFKKEISSADSVIEKVENFKNRDGKKGLRLIIQGRNKENGKEYYEIVWFGKWNGKSKGMYYTVGPNLEITLELERWLNKHK